MSLTLGDEHKLVLETTSQRKTDDHKNNDDDDDNSDHDDDDNLGADDDDIFPVPGVGKLWHVCSVLPVMVWYVDMICKFSHTAPLICMVRCFFFFRVIVGTEAGVIAHGQCRGPATRYSPLR